MRLYQKLDNLGGYPITHAVMLSLLKDYKRPNDKIHELLAEKTLIPLKKGLYVNASTWEGGKLDPMLIANHLLGPSYVSGFYMLSYYGFIPERVYTITSMTVKSAKVFENSIGNFSYQQLPLPYYAVGIKSLPLSPTQFAMLATPEKALCDSILVTKGLNFRSTKGAVQYLVDDMRADTFELKNLNIDEIQAWLHFIPKRQSIEFLLKAIAQF